MVGNIAVAGGHETSIDFERHRGAGVPQSVGYGAQVDARGQELSGNEMPRSWT